MTFSGSIGRAVQRHDKRPRLFAGDLFRPYHAFVQRYAFPFALLVIVLLGAHAIHLPPILGWYEDTLPAAQRSMTTELTAATHQALHSVVFESWEGGSHAAWCAFQAVNTQAFGAATLAVVGIMLPLLALRQASSGLVASAPGWRPPPQQQRALLQVFLF